MRRGNYRLAESSPCINTGTNDPGMAWQTDLDGNPRIYLGDSVGTVDMGCYEYVPKPAAGVVLALAIAIACMRYRAEGRQSAEVP